MDKLMYVLTLEKKSRSISQVFRPAIEAAEKVLFPHAEYHAAVQALVQKSVGYLGQIDDLNCLSVVTDSDKRHAQELLTGLIELNEEVKDLHSPRELRKAHKALLDLLWCQAKMAQLQLKGLRAGDTRPIVASQEYSVAAAVALDRWQRLYTK